MTSTVARAALLIDADNFSDPDQMRAVHGQFAQRVGKGFICHAHGAMNVWQRNGFKDALADIGGRFMPGLPLDKNTTDANLIIDALMLHFQHGIRRFGIASGDADFAPLAVQLRELGCDVAGYARHAIAFDRMANYYDHVVRFDVPPVKAAALVAPAPPPVMPPRAAKPSSAPVKTLAAPAPNPSPVPAKPIAPEPVVLKLKSPERPAPCLPDELARVLKLLPDLQNDTLHLSIIVPKLRQAGLIGKSASSVKWLAQWPALVALMPKHQPNEVALTAEARKLLQAVSAKVAPQPSPEAQEQGPAKNLQTRDLSLVLALSEPLMKRSTSKPLAPPWHGLRHVLHEVRYLKVTPLQVLQTAPELVSGARFTLGSVGARLRAKGLIDPAHSALRVLRHMERSFEVQTDNPQWVRYRG